jgi:hypothetical protein
VSALKAGLAANSTTASPAFTDVPAALERIRHRVIELRSFRDLEPPFLSDNPGSRIPWLKLMSPCGSESILLLMSLACATASIYATSSTLTEATPSPSPRIA